jgi:hypothetical protein
MSEANRESEFLRVAEQILKGARDTLGQVGWSEVMREAHYESVILGSLIQVGESLGVDEARIPDLLWDLVDARYGAILGQEEADEFTGHARYGDPAAPVILMLNSNTQIRRGSANRSHQETMRISGGLFGV